MYFIVLHRDASVPFVFVHFLPVYLQAIVHLRGVEDVAPYKSCFALFALLFFDVFVKSKARELFDIS